MRHGGGACGKILGFLATGFLLLGSAASAQDDARRAQESILKAAYLFQLPNFVAWPDDSQRRSQPFLLCVLGDADDAAIAAVEGRKVKGREIRLERLTDAADADRCEVLYIQLAEPDELAAAIERLRGASVLTVGDFREFARRGGMIGFVIREGRLQLEINPSAAERAGLKISAKLLELSRIVQDRPRP